MGFRAKNGELIEALANRLNRLRVSVDQFPLPDRGPIKKSKKHFLSFSSLSFLVNVFTFPIEVQSRVTVTCQSLNAPMANELINPQLDRLRLLFGFLGSQG